MRKPPRKHAALFAVSSCILLCVVLVSLFALRGTPGSPGDADGSGGTRSASPTPAHTLDNDDAATHDSDTPQEYVENEVLVTFEAGLTQEQAVAALEQEGVPVLAFEIISSQFGDKGILASVTYEGDGDARDISSQLSRSPHVAVAEPDYLYTICEDTSPEEDPHTNKSSDKDPDDASSGETVDKTVGEDDSEEGPEGAEEAGDDGVSEALADPTSSSTQDYRAAATVNDPYLNYQWGLSAIKALGAWDYAQANSTVTVAVIDTGVDVNHPDLTGNLILDYAKNTYTEQTGAAAVDDDYGHGTHVTGIIAATANNSAGIAGTSYNAKVLPIKANITSSMNFSTSDIIEGIEYIIALKTDSSSPAYLRAIRVINMSLGGPNVGEALEIAVDEADAAGILVVAAAGNDSNKKGICYPAGFESVVAVSSTYQDGSAAVFDSSYSNYGEHIDIAAPGTHIYSTTNDGAYGYLSGTSMAAPLVSGVAALVYTLDMSYTTTQAADILTGSAQDAGALGKDPYYGYGNLQAKAALGGYSVTHATVSPISPQTYTGSSLTPSPEVSLKGGRLQKGTDYRLFYKDNIELGTATVTIVGIGDYGGFQTVDFEIVKGLGSASVSSSGMTRNCTGATLSPTVSVWLNGQLLVAERDYELWYEGTDGTTYPESTDAPRTAGSYTVTVRGTGEYTGEQEVGTFILYDAAVSASVPYRVESASNPAFVLDAAEAQPARGSNISVWTDNGGANQVFTFELGTDGYYVIHSYADTGLVLDAAGATPVIGANVSVWTDNGGMNQRWVLVPVEGMPGQFKIASASNPTFVLDAAGATPSIGANVSVWTDNGGANQRWRLAEANDLASASVSPSGMTRNCTGAALSPTVTVRLNGQALLLGDDYELWYEGTDGTTYPAGPDAPSAAGSYTVTVRGIGNYEGSQTARDTFTLYDAAVSASVPYRVESASNPAFVLDAAEAQPVRGSNISVWTDNGGANQVFTFELGTDGYYVIHSYADGGLVLDAAGAVPQIGANVSVWTENGGANQRWVLIPIGDGTFQIASAYDSTFVLDAAGATPSIGANVSIWTDNGGANQRWRFVEANDLAD